MDSTHRETWWCFDLKKQSDSPGQLRQLIGPPTHAQYDSREGERSADL